MKKAYTIFVVSLLAMLAMGQAFKTENQTSSSSSSGASITTNANQFLGVPLSIRSDALLTNVVLFGDSASFGNFTTLGWSLFSNTVTNTLRTHLVGGTRFVGSNSFDGVTVPTIRDLSANLINGITNEGPYRITALGSTNIGILNMINGVRYVFYVTNATSSGAFLVTNATPTIKYLSDTNLAALQTSTIMVWKDASEMNYLNMNDTNIFATVPQLAAYAPLASPTFSGTVVNGGTLTNAGHVTFGTTVTNIGNTRMKGNADVDGNFTSTGSALIGGSTIFANNTGVRLNTALKLYWNIGGDPGWLMTSGNSNAMFTRVTLASTNGIWTMGSNGLASASITVGASAFLWTNNGANTTITNNINVFVDASTATTLCAIAKNGQTIAASIAASAMTVPLKPNEWLTLTYSGTAPTARWEPQ